MLRVARFLGSYMRTAGRGIAERDVSLRLEDGEEVPATLLSPAGAAPLPGWVLLHGITVPGRRHPTLIRFARALAASGGMVLVPEIRSWQRLRIDPAAADRVIAAAARHLADDPAVSPGGVGVVGFSFGATQGLITAAHPELRSAIRSVVGFGGYCHLGRTIRFMMTGEHEWQGVRHHLDPDPYGRWIVASNYLTRARGCEGLAAVASATGELAAEAGRRFVYAGSPVHDELKATLRQRLGPEERDVWDLLAPPSGTAPPVDEASDLGDRLVEAALSVHPQLDPRPLLPSLDREVVLAHGALDQLIPFTETLRLRSHMAEDAPVSIGVTRLFSHSRGADRLRLHEYPLEVFRYLQLLRCALR